jgi:hypothetical protein
MLVLLTFFGCWLGGLMRSKLCHNRLSECCLAFWWASGNHAGVLTKTSFPMWFGVAFQELIYLQFWSISIACWPFWLPFWSFQSILNYFDHFNLFRSFQSISIYFNHFDHFDLFQSVLIYFNLFWFISIPTSESPKLTILEWIPVW